MEVNNLEKYKCSCGQQLQTDRLYRCQECTQTISRHLEQSLKILIQQNEYYKIYKQTSQKNNFNWIQLEKKGLKQFDKQNQQLEKQLQGLNQQLRQQQKLEEDINSSVQKANQELCVEFLNFYKESLNLNRLNMQNDKISYKNWQMERQIGACQNINIVHELFKITFQNAKSFINGQLIYFQNSWKISQIICFFHHKYKDYCPTITIYLDQMIIAPLQEYADVGICKKKKRIIKDQQIEFIQILCNSQEQTQQWIYLIALQVIKLSQFMIKKQGCQQKLNYKMAQQGSIEGIRLNQYEKYLKYLLSNINQLIKMEFYLMESRIKVSH